MRAIVTILAVLLFAGWILSQVEIHSTEAVAASRIVVRQSDSSEWRYTVDGWEKMCDWAPVTPPSVDLHPLVVGLFILFVSVFSLIGFEVPAIQKD